MERGGQVSLSLLITKAKPVGLQALRQGRRALIVITSTVENAGAWAVCPMGLPLCTLFPVPCSTLQGKYSHLTLERTEAQTG